MKIKPDTLSNYLKATLENHTYHARKEPDLMWMIHKMDGIFHDEVFAPDYEVNAATMVLAMNSYMMLSSAVHMALSGHQVAVLPVARNALESACYAFLTSSDEEMSAIWFNRDKSKTAAGKCRRNFTIGATEAKLKHISPDMADYVRSVYEATIEYGAHPNIKAISYHLSHQGEVDDKYHVYTQCGVYGENSYQVNAALLLCVDIGQAIAFLLSASAKDHPFITERLAVFQSWVDEKDRVTDHIEAELQKQSSE
ncbi:hypothetical protein MWH03_00555 [Klebsiella pneumoniae]|nr:hypothetical protein [Klebsiella pneumoniae]